MRADSPENIARGVKAIAADIMSDFYNVKFLKEIV